MLAYGFDAVERDGMLVFKNRTGLVDGVIGEGKLAVIAEQNGLVELVRAPVAEVAGRVRLNYVEENGDYEIRATEAIFPDEATYSVSQSELPLALTSGESRAIVERWLAESRVARDGAKFALPLSEIGLGAGDVVRLSVDGEEQLFRLDHVEQSGAQLIEAIRVEPGVYLPRDLVDSGSTIRPFTPAVPTYPLFLDLPLMRGDEVPHAPHIAVTATPWPGSVAVYSSVSDDGYTLNRLVEAGSVIGVTENVLFSALPALPDKGAPLRVRVFGGALSSVAWSGVLNGENLMAIGDGSAENWELFQFATADPVEEGVYDLSLLLRGQLGTDAIMPADWPTGSQVVLLNGTPDQIELLASERNLARHYRIGPALRANNDPSYVHSVEAFRGIGLRPYAPCHLRVRKEDNDDLTVSWVRRTRVDGDSWESVEVPLGESAESYVIRVLDGGTILREETVSSGSWIYDAVSRAGDGTPPTFGYWVAQGGSSFGGCIFEEVAVSV
jgi:hypothetical protein